MKGGEERREVRKVRGHWGGTALAAAGIVSGRNSSASKYKI